MRELARWKKATDPASQLSFSTDWYRSAPLTVYDQLLGASAFFPDAKYEYVVYGRYDRPRSAGPRSNGFIVCRHWLPWTHPHRFSETDVPAEKLPSLHQYVYGSLTDWRADRAAEALRLLRCAAGCMHRASRHEHCRSHPFSSPGANEIVKVAPDEFYLLCGDWCRSHTMAIFKRKSKSAKAKAAEAQPVEEPKPKPEPFKPRHVRTNSNVTAQSQSRNTYGDVYQTKSSIYGYHNGEPQPPMPNTPTGRASNPQSRNSSTFFGPPSAPSFDSPILGNPKMAAAARDRGYINPHVPADSGYTSVAASSSVQSRAPSEKAQADLHARNPRSNTEASPEQNMGGVIAEGPGSIDSSLMGTTVETSSFKRSPESVLKSSNGYYTRAEESSDARLEKSTRISPKQARFEGSTDEESSSPQQVHQSASEGIQDKGRLQAELQPASVSEHVIDDHARISSPSRPQDQTESRQTPIMERGRYPVENGSGPVESQPIQDPRQTPSTIPFPRLQEESGRVPGHLSPSIPPPRSSARRASIPPLSILDGFKVNKRGKILNEEGEPIGELVHGDIMDCVRQKVNAMGEVLDEYGGVVGRVRTLERVSTIQPFSSEPRAHQPTRSHSVDHRLPPQYVAFVPHSPAPVAPSAEAPQSVFVSPPNQESRDVADVPSSSPPAHERFSAERQAQEAPQIAYLPPSTSPLNFESKDSQHNPPVHSNPVEVIDHSDIFIPGAAPIVSEKSPHRSLQHPQTSPVPTLEPHRDTLPSVQHRYEPHQQSVGAIPQLPNPAQSRRSNVAPLLRNLSDSSLSDLSKSYARPSMTSVPENEDLPDEDRNPARYSYKGEIPSADGPMPGARLPPPPMIGVRAATPQKPNLNGHVQPGQLSGQQYLSVAGAGPRRSVSQTAPGLRPSLSARNSYTQPLKPSPLSSQGEQAITILNKPLIAHISSPENSPPDSEVSNSDDGKHAIHMGQRPNMGPRPPSINTLASSNTAAGKPRTYFTHAGRVTVAPDEQTPTSPAPTSAPPKPEPAAPSAEKIPGRKKRFSLRLGKKS
nr:hypothetical protein CFP56_70251 [Quercus suber]